MNLLRIKEYEKSKGSDDQIQNDIDADQGQPIRQSGDQRQEQRQQENPLLEHVRCDSFYAMSIVQLHVHLSQ